MKLTKRHILQARETYGECYLEDLEKAFGQKITEGFELDENHPAFVAVRQRYRMIHAAKRQHFYKHGSIGVGTELKKLLKRINIVEKDDCLCGTRATAMDTNGIEWCEANVERIVDWMEEEAKTRRLPFLRVVGRMLVRQAIRNAKRKWNAAVNSKPSMGNGRLGTAHRVVPRYNPELSRTFRARR